LATKARRAAARGAKAGFKVEGLEELKRTFDALRQGSLLHHAVASALHREAELIMTAAKRQTPVDTGALRASGTVKAPQIKESSVSVEIGFGGSAVGYALAVHENLKARHKVGNAKYLERPFFEHQERLIRAVGTEVKTGIKKTVERHAKR
jgi:hypothetical protein